MGLPREVALALLEVLGLIHIIGLGTRHDPNNNLNRCPLLQLQKSLLHFYPTFRCLRAAYKIIKYVRQYKHLKAIPKQAKCNRGGHYH